MMNDTELDKAIAERPYAKVTKEGMEARIIMSEYVLLPDNKTTVCLITLENSFTIRGESSCVDVRNYNQKIGESIAYKDAFNKIWQLEGYLLAERNWAKK
jgi:hypothetical protein